MARRPDLNSDFAQKLLGDIRRRKERLGYASSPQQSSNATSSFNAESNSRRSFQGAQGTNRNNSHPQSSNNKGLPSPRRKTKQPTLKASSQEIVPYRQERAPSLDNTDVSMALTLALGHTGKLQNIEVLSRTKVGTEFVTHRGSIQFADPKSLSNGMGNNRNKFLCLTNFGVQKLREMINVYSGGRKQRSSWAMELEESLNMLIMLQDSSDYMGGSNKNQVLLLKDKEENENGFRSKSSKQSKLNSDKKSLSSYQRTVMSGRNVTTKKESHLSAATSSSNSSMNSSYGNSTRGNSEHSKLRIPSVVARLMGLEDLPQPVKPKEVELREKEEKGEGNIKRSSIQEKDMSANCHVDVREETRLERITRTYINSKRDIFGKSTTNVQKFPPKKNDEKAHVIRNQKKKQKPNNEIATQKAVTAPRKVVQKTQHTGKDLMKKPSVGNSHPSKATNSNLIYKKKDIPGSICQAKNEKVLEKGRKVGEKHAENNRKLMEFEKEKKRETEDKIANLEATGKRKDDGESSGVVFDQSLNEEKISFGITVTNLDAHKVSEICNSVEEEPQLPGLKEEQNDSGNYSKGSAELHYEDAHEVSEICFAGEEKPQLPGLEEVQIDSANYTKGSADLRCEDLLTENQILLREMLLNDSESLDLSQALFTLEVAPAKSEQITKRPLGKENNDPLLHTAREILKRKANRFDICGKFKSQSLNSLIRELDSDFRSLEYGRKSENFDSQGIIEREIEGGNPDSICTWEFGWNPKRIAPFEKCEIAKELEKHLTSGLITEVTRELIDEIILV